MWKNTARKVIDPKVRARGGPFRAMGGISLIVLIVVFVLIGVLAVLFLATGRH